jgi:hypothetical protein
VSEVSDSAAVGQGNPSQSVVGRNGSGEPVDQYAPGQPGRLKGRGRESYIIAALMFWSRWAKSSEMKDVMIAAADIILKKRK